MSPRKVVVCLALVALASIGLVGLYPLLQPEAPQPAAALASPAKAQASSETASAPAPRSPQPVASSAVVRRAPLAALNRADYLSQIRDTFRALARGDRDSAIRAAKELTDPTEREAAMLTLVTEWTQGNLHSPMERALDISRFGVDAGLGMELVKQPELAILWAHELADGPGKTVLLARTAAGMALSDPAAAFALSQDLPESDRPGFATAVFTNWALHDTEGALQWAQRLPDPAAQDDALRAIRAAAPVGIGTQLTERDGYPIITQLLPGTPAELSGQLRPGDRIIALAQGDNAFVDAHTLSLQDVVQMIRGAPNTVVQLQVISADAPADAPPRSVSITRDQIKLKQ